jgi:hypothetical protein
MPADSSRPPDDDGDESESLVLSDLINRVLDKGVVIRGEVTISVADIDLVHLDLRLLLTALESAARKRDADASILPYRRD